MNVLTELLTLLVKQSVTSEQHYQQCNYGDNYYGDQVCKPVANEKQ